MKSLFRQSCKSNFLPPSLAPPTGIRPSNGLHLSIYCNWNNLHCIVYKKVILFFKISQILTGNVSFNKDKLSISCKLQIIGTPITIWDPLTYLGPYNYLGPPYLCESPGTFWEPRALFGAPRTISDPWDLFRTPWTIWHPRDHLEPLGLFEFPRTYLGPSGLVETPGTLLYPWDLFGNPKTINFCYSR